MGYLAVFIGGGMGSVCRFAIAKLAIANQKELLWATLGANVIACAVLGYLTFNATRSIDPLTTKLLLATGFCGGFSTFSTFSLEAYTLIQQGRVGMAITYVLMSIILGCSAIGVFALSR